MTQRNIERNYQYAKEYYGAFGVDTDAALEQLARIPISLHCWQGDDVGGFEPDAGGASGGILSTGNYPGRARTPQELRGDLAEAFSLIPGKKRLNLHAIYLDSAKPVERNKIEPKHFQSWIDWAKEQKAGLDFNPTFFGHPKAASNLTLSHPDEGIRQFWIEHGIACRRIAAEMGRQLGTPAVMNTWIPDGFKDVTIDRRAARERLEGALDTMFAERIDPSLMRDAVESKLFGIGVESCTVGSNEFYLGYAVKNGVMLCLDSGHFHPTEIISDKIKLLKPGRPANDPELNALYKLRSEIRKVGEICENYYEKGYWRDDRFCFTVSKQRRRRVVTGVPKRHREYERRSLAAGEKRIEQSDTDRIDGQTAGILVDAILRWSDGNRDQPTLRRGQISCKPDN